MSGHQYITNPNNLFSDDADVDDETFLRNSRPKITHDPGYNVRQPQGSGSNSAISALEEQRQMMVQRRMEIEQRTLDSSSRSVGILRDSEQIGIATAEELLRQREQLERTSKRLDEINTNLRFSQKHINGIKSVFSSLKNYVAGKNDSLPKMSSPAGESTRAEGPTSPNNTGETWNNQPQEGAIGGHRWNQEERKQTEPNDKTSLEGGSKQMNRLLEANLDEMASSISRLKGLATGLGEEIETQNELIDNLTDKAETADLTINRQNKQMNKILGK